MVWVMLPVAWGLRGPGLAGYYLPRGLPMSKRMVIFVDYQNAYHSARGLFHDHREDPPWMGQFDPVRLGEHILRSGDDSARVVSQIRMYRGLPDTAKQTGSNRAAMRQNTKWESLPNVVVEDASSSVSAGLSQIQTHGEGH